MIPGANPTIESYNASAVKTHNATSSLHNTLRKQTSATLKKNSLAYYNASVVVVNSEVVGSAPYVGSQLPIGRRKQ
jgi:hypothetical protein